MTDEIKNTNEDVEVLNYGFTTSQTMNSNYNGMPKEETNKNVLSGDIEVLFNAYKDSYNKMINNVDVENPYEVKLLRQVVEKIHMRLVLAYEVYQSYHGINEKSNNLCIMEEENAINTFKQIYSEYLELANQNGKTR